MASVADPGRRRLAGLDGIRGLAAGFVLAAVAGLALFATGRATRKSQIAFGPYMLTGALMVVIAVGPLGS